MGRLTGGDEMYWSHLVFHWYNVNGLVGQLTISHQNQMPFIVCASQHLLTV